MPLSTPALLLLAVGRGLSLTVSFTLPGDGGWLLWVRALWRETWWICSYRYYGFPCSSPPTLFNVGLTLFSLLHLLPPPSSPKVFLPSRWCGRAGGWDVGVWGVGSVLAVVVAQWQPGRTPGQAQGRRICWEPAWLGTAGPACIWWPPGRWHRFSEASAATATLQHLPKP